MIATLQGELEDARTGLEGVLQKSQQLSLKSDEAACLAALGDVSLAEGDLPLAGKRYQQALQIQTQLGQKGSVAAVQVAQAILALEQNLNSQAELLARGAVQEFQQEKSPSQEAGARDVLAQALLAERRVEDAAAEIAAAGSLAANDPPTLFSRSITEARVLAAKGNATEAVRKLQGTSQRARETGLVPYHLQARLAIGQIQMASGDAGQGRGTLELLSREAQQLHYSLIARKADALLSAKPGK
jgi:ATP/maltotriose-dependent transcriptional regulator MalT